MRIPSRENAPQPQLPDLEYSIALSFGRLMVSKRASESLGIVPLVPTLEDKGEVFNSQRTQFDIVAVDTTEIPFVEESNRTVIRSLKGKTLFCHVPSNVSQNVRELKLAEIDAVDQIFGIGDDNKAQILEGLDAERSQIIAHAFSIITANQAAELWAAKKLARKNEDRTSNIKKNLLAATIGTGAVSLTIDTPFLRSIAVASIAGAAGFSSLLTHKISVVENSIARTDQDQRMYADIIYHDIHEAYCAEAMQERILGGDN
jgi:hypothetical protein